MKGALYLGWRYVVFHRVKTILLVGCLTLVLFLPLALRLLVQQTQHQLTARADITPLLVGAKGSPLELTLNALYFDARVPGTLGYAEAEQLRITGMAQVIPLHVRFRAREHPIVGTSLEYFELRRLKLAAGTLMQRLGDCVLGATAARELGLQPGDHLVSSPETVFDLAGTYPLNMRVTGVMESIGSPDDAAVFVDVKTTWVIQGLAHGHEDISATGATDGVLAREGGHVTANASLRQHREVTEENIDTFHFHGEIGSHPLTGIFVLPNDAKSATLLKGRYVPAGEVNQIIEPRRVMDELLATILTLQRYITMGMVLLGGAVGLVVCLVFMLSLRLRRREIETLHKIGGAPGTVRMVCAFEMIFDFLAASILAVLLGLVMIWLGPDLMGWLVR